jgi:hypothetical protein
MIVKTRIGAACLTTLLLALSSTASAAIALYFNDDFEDRVADQVLIGNNWTWVDLTFDTNACEGNASVFGPFTDPNDAFEYPADNRNFFTAGQQGDSYYRAGLEVPAWDGALTNMLRVYGNQYNPAQTCQEVRIFQEWTITDSGDFEFSFDVAKDRYGAPANGEVVGAFVQVLKQSDFSYNQLYFAKITSDPPAADATAAASSIDFDVPAEFVGELLQFGFYNNVVPALSQSWATSGAYYDNVALTMSTPPPVEPPVRPPIATDAISIPTLDGLGQLAMLLALAALGFIALNRRGH